MRARLMRALSGDPTGSPRWARELAEGDDEGYLPVEGAAWAVHSGPATLVAGVRALLVQALHPGALAGVQEFDRYREDPLGRLAGTVRWVVVVTYGSRTQVDAELSRVAKLHERVRGDYTTGSGAPAPYSASDPRLAEWVHLAFTDAFLTASRWFGGPIPGGEDAYVGEWVTAGRLMGVADPPTTAAELAARLQEFRDRGELAGGPAAEQIVDFLRTPPLGGVGAVGYRVIFESAVATLPVWARDLLGVRRSRLPVVTAARVMLPVVGRMLRRAGERPQDRARRRLARLATDP